MTPTQRLLVAVVLSALFFVGYSALYPQQTQTSKQTQNTSGATTQTTPSAQTNDIPEQTPTSTDATNSNEITLATISSEHFILKIDTLGRISSKELLDNKFNNKDDHHAQLIPQDGAKPLMIRFLDQKLNNEAKQTPYTADVATLTVGDAAKEITLTQKLSDVTVTKKITFFKDGHYDATISLTNEKRYLVYLGQRPRITDQMMTVTGAMVYTNDGITKITEDGDSSERKTFTSVGLISAFDQYSASIIYNLPKDATVIVDRDVKDDPVVYFEAMNNMKFSGYIGQKEFNTLNAINPILTNAIEYGWFTFASKPLFALLAWLYAGIGNWGWSIIALTILIRLVLYPLTYKGMVSMQKMKDIAPQIKEIQAKYKGEPQRLHAATMDMYKKHGANPLGGCLPMLLQIPVFFAIYRVLLNAVELQGAPWILWVNDLSRMDTTFVLPILMGASMYYQQKLTPNNFTDPIQEKVFKYLPVVFTFFFVTFPAGLVLYWFVNNLFSILQQFIVNQQFKNAKDARAALKSHHGDEK